MPGATDPLAAIKVLDRLATPNGTALVVLRNYHRFLASPEIVQALDTALSTGKQRRTFVVILAPMVQLPAELERQFVVTDHELPGTTCCSFCPATTASSPRPNRGYR